MSENKKKVEFETGSSTRQINDKIHNTFASMSEEEIKY